MKIELGRKNEMSYNRIPLSMKKCDTLYIVNFSLVSHQGSRERRLAIVEGASWVMVRVGAGEAEAKLVLGVSVAGCSPNSYTTRVPLTHPLALLHYTAAQNVSVFFIFSFTLYHECSKVGKGLTLFVETFFHCLSFALSTAPWEVC